MSKLLMYVYNNDRSHSGAMLIKGDKASLAKAIIYYGMRGHSMVVTDCNNLPTCQTCGMFIYQWVGNGVNYSLQEFQQEHMKYITGADKIQPSSFKSK